MTHTQAIKTSCFAIAASLAAVSGSAAFAQTETTAAEADANAPQDIIVTAQRRPERLQEIPVAVTAFTEGTIRDLNLNDAIAVSKFVPSMISQHNAGLASANAYYLRGLGNSQSVATFDPPVGTYVDNIYIARQNANNYAFFDTERVEVLRGPQGTLFGRNTTGGAMSVIMRKPGKEFGGKFEATAGSYERVTAKAIVDLPVSSSVLTKLSAFYINDKGYLKNITTGESLNGERSYGVRGDVRFLPNEDLTIDISGEYTRNTGTYLGMRGVPVPSPRFRTTTTPVFYETATNMRKTSCDGDPVTILLSTSHGLCSQSDSYAVTGNVSYATDAGTLEAIVGWRKLNQGYINNYSASTVNRFNGYVLADYSVNKQHSGELKWTGETMDDRLRYVAGIFYLKELNELLSADFQGPVGATSYSLLADRHFKQKVETAAAYLQADFEIVPNLTITGGARYTWEQKNLEFFRSTRFPGFGFDSAAAIAAGIPLELTQKRVTPRVAVSYKLDPNVLLFASVTNGFKSGGWNGNAAVASRVLPFRPEVTWSYEAGLKSELFDRKLRVNLTGYLADTKDVQITSGIIPPGETAIVSLARNAGTLRAYGLEFETAYQFNRNFNIFVNGSVNRGEYSTISLVPGIPLNLQVQESTVPVRIPRFQLSSGATFRYPVEALGGSLGITAAYRHNSPYWVALLNTAQAPTEDFVDLQVSFEDEDGRFGTSLGVTNLTKQETITANFLSLFPGDPRRFTGRIWFNF